MLVSFTTALAVALVSLSTGTGAVLTNCAVCSPTLFYQGITWTLLVSPGGENAVDCHYFSPLEPNSQPTCSYREIDGHLSATNTPRGTCPDPVPVVKKQMCSQ
ncbi:hypothetical protein FB451DRAFT_1561437 [Mycena latifolia]|nr:hypothetical protein FB451DRAFT_1561437 [Mycena latifolia]